MNYTTAIIHEWLTVMAGSEKVLEQMYALYPSPIHVLVAGHNAVSGTSLAGADIRTSFIQKLPFAGKKYRSYLPLYPLAVEQFDVADYDVILSCSHAVAKGVLKRSDQLHICYCCTPMRYIWDVYHEYLRESNLASGMRSMLARMIIHYLRMWDIIASNRVDYFIADSRYVAQRINNIYRRDAAVIYPPVDVDLFDLKEKKDSYYLTASRMVPYKRHDIVVEAFTRMPDKKLVVIGDGPEMGKIKKIAGKSPNIHLLGHQPFDAMRTAMQNARAFIFAALEDFGIMPVEAQACGTPVIAYGRGGALETVIHNKTGIHFHRQTPDAIIEAVDAFEQRMGAFEPKKIRKHAMIFHRDRFRNKYKKFVEQCIHEFYAGTRS